MSQKEDKPPRCGVTGSNNLKMKSDRKNYPLLRDWKYKSIKCIVYS